MSELRASGSWPPPPWGDLPLGGGGDGGVGSARAFGSPSGPFEVIEGHFSVLEIAPVPMRGSGRWIGGSQLPSRLNAQLAFSSRVGGIAEAGGTATACNRGLRAGVAARAAGSDPP
jgi:hypothetical protein